jgi:trehalose/maltose hydrolase-like predicted phosphorylase
VRWERRDIAEMREGMYQRFEAVIFDWDVTAARTAPVDVEKLRLTVSDLCATGMVVAIISAAHLDDLRAELAASPAPGRLFLCPHNGSQLFEWDANEWHRVDEPGLSVDEHRKMIGDATDYGNRELDRLFGALWRRGISPRAVLLVPDAVDVKPLLELLDVQLRARRELSPPRSVPLAGWTLTIEGLDSARERARESIFTLADGRFGTRGSLPWDLEHAASTPGVFAAGVFAGEGPEAHLFSGPLWNHLPGEPGAGSDLRRTLDLRGGTLEQVWGGSRSVHAFAFSSLARPGLISLRAEAGATASAPEPLRSPVGVSPEVGRVGEDEWMRVAPGPGAMVAAGADRWVTGRVERLAGYAAAANGVPEQEQALMRLAEAQAVGFEGLLEEHRQAWAGRWDRGDVEIEGDDELRLAVRFGLFHLMSSVASDGEAAVGARGLSGEAYRGHVFWDSDVFVLPYLAATHPAAARAMLEYRIRRLDAAMAGARRSGCSGARFPWESAATGEEVTPTHWRDPFGQVMPIRTGLLEVHIVADVAWASAFYEDWTGDEEFADGPGLRLLVETARYWASRARLDQAGRVHIYDVMGPDEYHEAVDDNAFTNVMARWNLRRAAASVETRGGPREEALGWLELADRLVDNYDPASGLYEQFIGFAKLEPLIVAEAAPRRPVAAELLFGWERVRKAQVVKQADVLMLHHLVPEEVAPGSLEPNLAFYEPRTAHGSSLSPAVHVSLLARAGRLEEAVTLLELAARLDIDDLTGTTAGGLHVACMGGVWQSLVFGFLGARVRQGVLQLQPVLPARWRSLRAALTVRGSPVRVKVTPGGVDVEADGPLTLELGGRLFDQQAGGRAVFQQTETGWTEAQA